MSGMVWIALELRNTKIGLNTRLSLPVKSWTAFEIDGVTKRANTKE